MKIIEITDSGIANTNRDAIFQSLMQTFKNIYGGNVYIEKGTIDYNMISLLADLFSDMGNVAVSSANGLNLTSAVGTQLDNLASVYYGTLLRRKATSSTVVLVITGVANTTIVNGQVRDNFGGIWNLPETVTIGEGGSVNVLATYSQTGSYYIDANQIGGISSIATPVAGWVNVSQPNECNVGSNVETDAEFRVRIAQRSKGSAVGTLGSLTATLQAIEGITGVVIYENDTDSSDSSSVSGLTMPAHSISPVVALSPDLITDNNFLKQVANAIYNNKSSGVATNGTTTIGLTSMDNSIIPSGQSASIEFTIANTNAITINVVLNKIVATALDLSADTKTALYKAIQTQIDSYRIGDTVYSQDFYLPIIQTLNNLVGANQYNITSVNVNNESSLVLQYDEKAVLGVFNLDGEPVPSPNS